MRNRYGFKKRSIAWLLNNWVLAIALAVGITYLILWIFFEGKYHNFSYPFNVDVFGSVSDWTMVLVTAVTAHYLWKTLESQKEVQRMQQGLFDIEEYKFFQSIKPDFSHKFDCKPKHRYGGGRKEIMFSLSVTCENHKATDVEVSSSYNFQSQGMNPSPAVTEAEIERGETFPAFDNEVLEIPANNRFYLSVDIIIMYFDTNKDNKYQKHISIQNTIGAPFNFREYISPPIHIWKRPKEEL